MITSTSWRLESDLDATNAELATIYQDVQSLACAIERLVRDFADQHSVSISLTLDGISDSLLDLANAAAGSVEMRAEELKRQIAAIEKTDLQRSAPIVL